MTHTLPDGAAPATVAMAAPARRGYAAYRDSGVPWLGQIPTHWQVGKLGAVASVKARLGWKGLKASEYVDDGYIFLSTPNIKGREIDFTDVNFITSERYDESPEIMLQQGDVLIAKDGSTLGTVGVVRSLPAPATVNSSLAVIRPRSAIDSVFFYWYATSHYIQSVIQRMKDGMGVPHLFQADLRKFVVLLPPLDEQRAIAAYLDRETAHLDALVAKKQRLIALLREKRAALISHAVTRGLDAGAPLQESGVPWLGQIPAHWEVKRLKFVAELATGHTPSRSVPEYWENCTIPWVSLNDVGYLKDHDYIDHTTNLINELGLANSSARLLPAETVVLSRDATVGRCGILARPMATAQHFVNWICGSSLLPEYLLMVFRGPMQQEFERLTMGATIRTIGMPDVGSFVVPVPPLEEQRAIVAELTQRRDQIDALMGNVERQIETLKEYRAALIAAAVTGKIDVRGSVSLEVVGG